LRDKKLHCVSIRIPAEGSGEDDSVVLCTGCRRPPIFRVDPIVDHLDTGAWSDRLKSTAVEARHHDIHRGPCRGALLELPQLARIAGKNSRTPTGFMGRTTQNQFGFDVVVTEHDWRSTARVDDRPKADGVHVNEIDAHR
jgi:hypothetical protein